jgi:hypothetical protein
LIFFRYCIKSLVKYLAGRLFGSKRVTEGCVGFSGFCLGRSHLGHPALSRWSVFPADRSLPVAPS